MVKFPKRFCYYCNHIIDCKRQNFVKCFGCETFCHTDCIEFECDQNDRGKNKKNRGKKSQKLQLKIKIVQLLLVIPAVNTALKRSHLVKS